MNTKNEIPIPEKNVLRLELKVIGYIGTSTN